MGGHAFQARRGLDLATLTARLKPCPSTNVPIPAVFRSQLMLCPATSWQKSGAVILSEGKDRSMHLQITCIDPSRPGGHSEGLGI